MYKLLLDEEWETCTFISKLRDTGYNYAKAAWNKLFEFPFLDLHNNQNYIGYMYSYRSIQFDCITNWIAYVPVCIYVVKVDNSFKKNN